MKKPLDRARLQREYDLLKAIAELASETLPLAARHLPKHQRRLAITVKQQIDGILATAK